MKMIENEKFIEKITKEAKTKELDIVIIAHDQAATYFFSKCETLEGYLTLLSYGMSEIIEGAPYQQAQQLLTAFRDGVLAYHLDHITKEGKTND